MIDLKILLNGASTGLLITCPAHQSLFTLKRLMISALGLMQKNNCNRSFIIEASLYIFPNVHQEDASLEKFYKFNLTSVISSQIYVTITPTVECASCPILLLELIQKKILNGLSFPHKLKNLQINKITKMLKALKIGYCRVPPKPIHKISNFLDLFESASTAKFIRNKHEITVENYFNKKYNIKLMFPGYPLVATEIFVKDLNSNSVIRNFLQQLVAHEYKFALVIVDNKIYNNVKNVAETYVDFTTQCIKIKTLLNAVANGASDKIYEGICSKLNTKLGGKNYEVKNLQNKNEIFFGVDVTHPDKNLSYSIAAIVSSIDAAGGRYKADYCHQEPNKEIIDNLYDAFINHLNAFNEENHQLLERIFYCRDGISNSQYNDVKNIEIEATKKIYKNLQSPEIIVFVALKRHRSRFFVDTESKNIPGSVIDTDIVEKQFLLLSHLSIQNVARPTKYEILVNDSKLNNAEIKQKIFDLCHGSARINKSSSYPLPIFYAHLSASRAKTYSLGEDDQMGKLPQIDGKWRPTKYI
ncbi:unnamed protein product [Chironomus riparius]|uniref:Piwi domain-containing protein n=1 Tax=Chironomus riparius TaxID=315576 RepID=A0A9N9S593_9DIPT|nr:unnamed protein product [Chironomus riparius]